MTQARRSSGTAGASRPLAAGWTYARSASGAGLLLLRRLLGRVLLCLSATFLAYLLACLTFDPLAQLQAQQPAPSAEVVAARGRALGLDQPVPVRFLGWLSGLPGGDFGVSVAGRALADEVWLRAGSSLRLFLTGSLIAVVLGCIVGIRSALDRRPHRDQTSMIVSLVIMSVPVFVLGTVLKLLWLPVNGAAGVQILAFSGETTAGADHTGVPAVVDRLQHLVLPTIAIALPQIAYFSRYQRAAMLDVIDSDHLRTARAKGLSLRAAVRRHGLRMALVPTTSLFAFSFGLHLAGGVFSEKVFGWHGMGEWMIIGIQDNDATVVAVVTFFIGSVVVTAGWLADLSLLILDPRLRGAG